MPIVPNSESETWPIVTFVKAKNLSALIAPMLFISGFGCIPDPRDCYLQMEGEPEPRAVVIDFWGATDKYHTALVYLASPSEFTDRIPLDCSQCAWRVHDSVEVRLQECGSFEDVSTFVHARKVAKAAIELWERNNEENLAA